MAWIEKQNFVKKSFNKERGCHTVLTFAGVINEYISAKLRRVKY